MKDNERIKDETALLERLAVDIEESNKAEVCFFAGHFPLVYGSENIEGLEKWGEFSLYSLELACQLGQQAKKVGKVVTFVFFVDDHIYEDWHALSTSKIRTARRSLYRVRSGKDASLPKAYMDILEKYGFGVKDVLRHDHGKRNRHDCLYFSEKILRASERQIENACAREYIVFIKSSYFNKDTTRLVAFIPLRCEVNICKFALDSHIKGLSASHVFMETMVSERERLSRDAERRALFTRDFGVNYRED